MSASRSSKLLRDEIVAINQLDELPDLVRLRVALENLEIEAHRSFAMQLDVMAADGANAFEATDVYQSVEIVKAVDRRDGCRLVSPKVVITSGHHPKAAGS